MTAQKYKTIDRNGLKATMDSKEKFHLWNVVTNEYYRPESNIPGSQWIPVDTLTEKLVSEKVAAKTDAIIAYCGGPRCPASKQAAEKLAFLGYTNVFAYEGGIKDWSEAGLPLVKL
jgi:rhodanese-related sulfurtransferase